MRPQCCMRCLCLCLLTFAVRAARLLRQMLQAVSYLHRCRFLHRDLKLENFVLEGKRGALKLVDFEMAQADDGEEAVLCGTPGYIAPELLEGCFGPASDLWSLGICAFALLAGTMPEEGFEDSFAEVQPWASPEAQSFVKGLLCEDPLERLTAEEALMHPFLADRDLSERKVDGSVADALHEFSRATPLRRLCAMAMVSSLGPEDRATIRDAFEALDVSQSGSVSSAEFAQALSDPGRISHKDARKTFRSLTCHEHLSYSEFATAMCTTLIPIREGHVKDIWRRLSGGASKPVSVDELQSACRDFGTRLRRTDAEAILAEASATDPCLTYEALREYLRPAPATSQPGSSAASPQHISAASPGFFLDLWQQGLLFVQVDDEDSALRNSHLPLL